MCVLWTLQPSIQIRSLAGGNWINNKNGIGNWKAITQVDLRTRSDTAQPNKSPQTTILPALR